MPSWFSHYRCLALGFCEKIRQKRQKTILKKEGLSANAVYQLVYYFDLIDVQNT